MASISIELSKTIPVLRSLPKQLVYVLRLYLLGMVCLAAYRLILLLQEFHQLYYLPKQEGTWLVVKAFLMGFRFDTVVLGYILTLPFLMLATDAVKGWNSKWFYRLVFWLVSVGYVFAFFVCTSDLPYFHHFYTRITMAVMISTGTDSSNLLGGMILKEWRYLWPLLPFFFISWFFMRKHKRLLNNILYKKENASPGLSLRWFSGFGLLLFMGIWGRLSFQSHLEAGTAYFSDYGFPNMLALNPVYTFGLSYVNSLDPTNEKVKFMGDGEAVRKVQEGLKIPAQQPFDSPIARQITFAPESQTSSATSGFVPPAPASKPPNVIFIIMESMSAQKMGRYGNPNNLTPFMDSLAQQGLAFDSVFTTSIHTFGGIYSTLFSQPVIKRQHPLLNVEPCAGIGSTLKQQGYSTIYFTTHDKNFDNVGNFLTANGFDRIVSMDDYPKERILSSLGVGDDYLYEHATGELDQLADSGKPFFAAIMTGSDHGPYITPDYFKPKHKDAMIAIVEYVDWSLQKFFRLASQRDWFENTLFVIVADHGSSVVKRYDLPLSYFHTPLIFYAPQLLGSPKSRNSLGSQMDIFPTTMGILKLPYVNNSFGIDLLREQRQFVLCNADDKFAVANTQYIYVSRDNGVESLYRYQTNDLRDYLQEKPELVEEMKEYGESVLQAGQWLRKNGKTKEQLVIGD